MSSSRILFIRLPVILLILAVSLDLSGQFKFSEAFIITHEHDTLQGEIDIKSSRSLADKCVFRKNRESQNEVYYPGEIQGFYIYGYKYFVSREIPDKEKTKKVFLEYMVDGVVDLYCDFSFDEPRYFLEKASEFYELTNEDITIEKNDKIYSQPSEKYKGMIRYVFQDEPKLMLTANNTAFSHGSLIKITEEYHNLTCDDYSCITYRKSMKADVAIEPFYGYSYSLMGVRDAEGLASGNSHVLGGKLRYEPARLDQGWSINLGLYASVESFADQYVYTNVSWIDNIQYTERSTYLLEYQYGMIRIPFLLEYSFSNKRIQPFIAVGYDNVFIISPVYRKTVVSSLVGEEILGSTRSVDITERYQMGFLAETGLKYMFGKRSYLKLTGSYEFRCFFHYLEKVHTTRIDLSYGVYLSGK